MRRPRRLQIIGSEKGSLSLGAKTIKKIRVLDLYSLLIDFNCIVFRGVLICMRQGSANERYRNTVKLLLLPTTISQKDEKPHTTDLDDTAILHVKILKILIPQYRNPQCPPVI